MPKPLPASLLVVRHGESAGNVARDAAEAQGLERIDIALRDVDVPLSETGLRQAEALGHRLGADPEPPTVVWCSPYVRAQQTARHALEVAGLDVPVLLDERLREREFGVLDGLTRKGITAVFPDESERRARIGKFFHRPPGGESWSDVLLRLRSGWRDLREDHEGERVLLVAHQVVVLLVRYLLEDLDEAGVMEVDRAGDVRNCGVTTYVRDGERMRLVEYDDVSHLREEHEPVTAEPDASAAPR